MSKITPCLWFDGQAEEAARRYVSLLPNSRIDHVGRAPSDFPGGREGDVLLVDFTLAGCSYQGLNGGPAFPFTEAVSFSISTADQAETDRLWDALIEGGGAASECGWLKDRWGVSWQIVPEALARLLKDPDPARARRAMNAMLAMTKIDIAAIVAAADGGDG